jgi:glycosyltransferase involved in cell wall biosynthesis
MSCGLPCVAFDCYGMKEIIEHKKNGYLAKPYSIEDFKKGINYALLNKIKLSYYANDLVRKNFSYKIINTRYYNFFNNVLS